jgi:simple sugar transport system substrate-binding protein
VTHKRLRGAHLAALLVILGVLAGAAYAGTARHSAKVTQVAFATPGKANDYGWAQVGISSAKAAAASNGAKVRPVITDIGYGKTDVVLRQLAKSGANFIIPHASGFNTNAARLAPQLKVPMITYDNPKLLVKNYVSNITTSSQEGAYLAGILAAKMTKLHKLGIVISATDPNWYKMSGGFAAGARSVNKTSKILFATISPTGYDDAAGGKRVAASVIAQGADVLITMGDGATFGYLQAVETQKTGHKVWMIGDIGNLTPIDTKHVFLSSVLWDFTKQYSNAIKDINAGTYGTHGYNLSLKNGGVSLLKTKYIPSAVWSEIQKAKNGIVSGKIKVPNCSTKGCVTKLIG